MLPGVVPARAMIQLGDRVTMHRKVHLVLHRSVEALGGSGSAVVIHGSGVQIRDFLVELALAGADLPDALQLLFKSIYRSDKVHPA